MVNDQLPWLTPFSQQDTPGLTWHSQDAKDAKDAKGRGRGDEGRALCALRGAALVRSRENIRLTAETPKT